jgi:hypothetical protein
MVKRCTLDDFVKKNKYPVTVGKFSHSVRLKGMKEYAHPTEPFNLELLTGKGYLLEARNVHDWVDISEGIGLAYILQSDGSSTGYHLLSHGAGKEFWYEIEDDLLQKQGVFLERYIRNRGKDMGNMNRKVA